MTKKLIIGALMASATVSAQVQFGATVKGHLSHIRGIHAESKGRIAPSAGVFAQIPLASGTSSGFYFVPQLEVSMDGEKNSATGGEQKLYYTFLNMPLFVKYYFQFCSADSGKGFFAMAGPKIGFSLGEKIEGSSFTQTEVAVHHSFKKSNFGFAVGAGYHFIPQLEAFVRYDHGFTKVYDMYSGATRHYQLGAGINYVFSGL